MTPEGKVKAHLFKRVKALGGEARNVQWIGRKNAPDVFVMLPQGCWWAETKQLGDDARAGQLREHRRMRKFGQSVALLDSIWAVDCWFSTRVLP